MYELCLKADSYDSFFAACDELGLVEDGEIITKSENHDFALLGTLYVETDEIDENDNPVMVALDGYHVNALSTDADFMKDYQIEVSTPKVVWSK
jgi:sugar phosphate isomerase/epimerase